MSETGHKENRQCAVCGSAKKRRLFRQRFSTLSSGSLLEGYDVVACQECGFCYADNIPDQTIFDRYYREMSKYEHSDRGGHESPYELARLRAIASTLKPFLHSQQSRILEIGCATGRLLYLLRESGYENVMGIDPSPACAQAARRLYDIQVLTNTLSDASIEDQSVDFLILVGVLEHVRELDAALAKLWRMLSPNGRIFATVPDASRYAEGEDAPFQEFSVEHINFFGPVSLENLMHSNGFSAVFCQQSLVEANYRTTTPVVHALYKKVAAIPPGPHLTLDTQTGPGLIAYITQSRQVDERIRVIVDEIASSGKPIIVWGTGAHTLRLLATSRLGEANVAAFVDSNPRYQGKQLNGIPIIAPTALVGRPEPILISSRAFQPEIEHQIRHGLRCGNEVILLYQS